MAILGCTWPVVHGLYTPGMNALETGDQKKNKYPYIFVSQTGVEPEILPMNSATDLLLTSDDTMKMVPK